MYAREHTFSIYERTLLPFGCQALQNYAFGIRRRASVLSPFLVWNPAAHAAGLMAIRTMLVPLIDIALSINQAHIGFISSTHSSLLGLARCLPTTLNNPLGLSFLTFHDDDDETQSLHVATFKRVSYACSSLEDRVKNLAKFLSRPWRLSVPTRERQQVLRHFDNECYKN